LILAGLTSKARVLFATAAQVRVAKNYGALEKEGCVVRELMQHFEIACGAKSVGVG
jgi:hypothetical protein